MRKLLLGLAALPLCFGIAVAAQPLTGQQMDQITAGWTALSIADAEGLVGRGSVIVTTTGSVSQITPYATATIGESSATVWKSVSAAQSSSVSSAVPAVALPGLSNP